MKTAPASLSAEDLALFDGYIKKWQERLGLQGWRVERSKRRAKKGNMAEVHIDHKSRLAAYRVGAFGAADVTPESIEATALHELLHVMLYELVNQVEIELTGEALESAEHRVIHVLEKLLLQR